MSKCKAKKVSGDQNKYLKIYKHTFIHFKNIFSTSIYPSPNMLRFLSY